MARRVPNFGDDEGSPREDLGTTALLLERYRRGDATARDLLLRRYYPILQRWAHGRLPPSARGVSETSDLVQLTLIRALSHLKSFEPRREGAFLAYLRQILLNQVRDEIRRVKRRPKSEELPEELPEREPSPLEELIGKQMLESYDRALARLPVKKREAVLLRIEFGFTHEQIAAAIGSPSTNAARMLLTRALVELAEEMGITS